MNIYVCLLSVQVSEFWFVNQINIVDLMDKETTNSWTQASWIVVSIVIFTIAWSYTSGGYLCSVPLTLLLLLYTITHSESKGNILIIVQSLFTEKISELLQADKRPFILLTSYWSFLAFVSFWYPYMESSNGSPYSLIFFSIVFCVLYIVPSIVWLMLLPLSTLLRWKDGISHGKQSRDDIMSVFHIIWNEKFIILTISGAVILMFLFDADITVILRYVMQGKPCWPMLIPKPQQLNLPYPLKYSWIKWNRIFAGYTPGAIQMFVQTLGRELGEVSSLLPVVIGVYVVSLFILHSKHTILRATVFSCLAGVVIGGISSGMFKLTIHRYRPNAYGDPYKWTGPGTATVNHLAFSKLDLSFPAGHTTVTSAVATCLYVGLLELWKECSIIWKLCMSVLLYIFPVAVLISRVSDCYHWNSDATFGVSSLPLLNNIIFQYLLLYVCRFYLDTLWDW